MKQITPEIADAALVCILASLAGSCSLIVSFQK